ncbi:ABC transporter ATP-binding protein [Gracilibacillus sp. HCP3S3_G5_1]|uniref:ABC transporter ATP-binding protein n=1 Tax=unclassified Gracilibacillus TaxID=2625209 RepID=UPI003F8AC15D
MTYLMELMDVNIDIKQKQILRDVNFKFEKGKIYGLLGPNGAGKTTLLKSMLGVFKPTSGDILFNECNIYNHPSENILKEIGSIIEFPGFYANLTLSENLALHMKYHNINYQQEQLDKLLNFVGLHKHKDKLFSQTSLGMKQRMGIARSLANDPQLLLLDEPTNGLDPQGIKQVREMLIQEVELNDRTIIVSSHLLSEISLIADQLIFMNNGKIILTTENKEEMNLFQIQLTHVEEAQINEIQQISGIEIIKSNPSYLELITSMEEPELLSFINKNLQIKEMKCSNISLEDLYLYLLSDAQPEEDAQYAIS